MGEKTLKEKTFSGLSWSATDKLFQQLFVLISGILLARMLGKENYGLIGVLAVFTGMANLLQESGFTSALIRKKNAQQDDYMTVFYTNICISFILYLILFICAPVISDFYDKPILTPLARFIFLSFLFNSFAVIQNAKLIKEINYRLTAKINLFSVLVSYSSALIMAYFGFGVWALAVQIVTISFMRTICLWIFGEWRPGGSFSKDSFKEFFSFGSKLVAGGIMNSFTTNIPQNIIAKQYTLGVTGLYNQAFKLFNTVSDFLSGTIQNVPFTVLSNINEEQRLKNANRKFIRAKAFIIFPLFMGMMLVAEPFVTALLGSQWEGTAPILQLLCIGGIFGSLDSSNGDILRVKGKAGRILSLEIFRNVILAIVLIACVVFRINYLYLVGGLSATYFIKYLLSAYIANKTIDYKIYELIKDIFPYFFVASFCIFCGYLFRFLIDNQLLLLIFQIIFVGLLYICILFFSGSVLVRETFDIMKKLFRKKD